MYIMVESSDSTTAAGTPNTPSGWQKLGEWTSRAGATGVTTLTLFGKIAGAGEANVTIDGVGNHCAAAMVVIAGHGLASISATVVGERVDHATGTTNLNAAAINCAADSLILLAIGLSDAAADTTNVSGVTNGNLAAITEQIDQTVATGAGGGLGIYTATCAGTNTGATEWDHDTAERSQSVQLAIPPTGVTGPRLIQKAGAIASNATSVAAALPQDVTSGNLLIIKAVKFSPSDDEFVAGDCTKTSGTATVGTVTRDASVSFDNGSGFQHAAIWSVPVTGNGSCGLTVGGALSGSFLVLSIEEWEGLDAGDSRMEDFDSGSAATGAPATAAATSAGVAMFAGIVATNTSVFTPHTPGADYTTSFEAEDGANTMTGSSTYRVVASGTTDAADWTAPSAVDWAAVVAVYKAASASAYDETGRQITALAILALTDLQHYLDQGLRAAALAVVATTDVQKYRDLGLAVPISAIVAAAEAQHYLELGLVVPVTGVVTVADAKKFDERGLQTTAVGVVAETDRQAYEDAGLQVTAAGTVTVAEALHAAELGLAVTIQGQASADDVQRYREAALAVSVDAVLGAALTQHYLETGLQVSAAAIAALTDVEHYKDLGLTVPVTALVSVADSLGGSNEELSLVAVAAVSATDLQRRLETNLGVAIATQLAVADAQHYHEALQAALGVTLAGQDVQAYADLDALIQASGQVTGVDVQRYLELGLSVVAAAIVTGTDVLGQARPGIPVYVFRPSALRREFEPSVLDRQFVPAAFSRSFSVEVPS